MHVCIYVSAGIKCRNISKGTSAWEATLSVPLSRHVLALHETACLFNAGVECRRFLVMFLIMCKREDYSLLL